jgi:hypothetical protein
MPKTPIPCYRIVVRGYGDQELTRYYSFERWPTGSAATHTSSERVHFVLGDGVELRQSGGGRLTFSRGEECNETLTEAVHDGW